MKILEQEIPNSFVLFFLPVLGFSLSYVFEIGYFAGYGIDQQFIQVDSSRVLIITIICGAVLYMLEMTRRYLRLINKFALKLDRLLKKRTGLAIALVVLLYVSIAVATYIVIHYRLISLPPHFLFLLMLTVTIMLCSVIVEIDVTQVLIKRGLINVKDDNAQLKLRDYSRIVSILVVVLIACGVFGYLLSTNNDRGTYTYTLVSGKQMVVLRKYGNTIYTKEYNAHTHHLSNSLYVTNVGNRNFIRATFSIKH